MLHNTKITKELFDELIEEFAIEYKNTNANKPVELTVVGGSAIMLNYQYRLSTIDIDAYFKDEEKIKSAIDAVAKKRSLASDWLNKDFINTPSFSEKIFEVSTVYKSLYDGFVIVRTLEPKYLLAMKLKSSRPTGGDMDDIIKMIYESRINGEKLTYRDIMDAYDFLYQDRSGTYDYFFKKAKEAFETPIEEVRYLMNR